MHKKILNLISCPECSSEFKMFVFDESPANNYVKEGILVCPCGIFFPIVNSIPRFSPDTQHSFSGFYVKFADKIKGIPYKLRCSKTGINFKKRQKQTISRFETQWKKWGRESVLFGHTKMQDKGRILEALPKDLDATYFKGKYVLDAGCGHGRYSEIFAEMGAETFAVDIGCSVEIAKERTRSLPNAHIIQADIMWLPFRTKIFDFVWSFGVIHHTSNTRSAFNKLTKLLKQEGALSIWVYPKGSVVWEISQSLIRSLTTRLPPMILYYLCFIPVPLLSIVKTFSGTSLKNSNWRQCAQVIFDWYSPRYQSHHSPMEIIDWFKEEGFTKIVTFKPDTGITGLKKKT